MKKTILLFICLALIDVRILFADTIYFTEGNREKGLIVEEYSDRFILNTESGPKEVLKKDIKEILYDTPEQNLMQLGKLSEDRGNFTLALYYYRQALNLNPNSEIINDAIERAQGKALQGYSAGVKEAVEEKNIATEAETRGVAAALDEKSLLEKIKNSIGVSVKRNGDFIEVESVVTGSASDKAGILAKDRIVTLWGISAVYKDFYSALKEIDGPQKSLLKLSIEREIELKKPEGIELKLKIDGLFVKKSSNPIIKINDKLIKINKSDAAYISVKEADNIFSGIENYPLKIKLQKTLYIIRE